MSYKDGIPLLTSFEDGADDDDDFNFDTVISPRRRWFNKRHCLFVLVLTLAVFLILGIIVGITVPVVMQSHGSSGGPAEGNETNISLTPSIGSRHSSVSASMKQPVMMSTSLVTTSKMRLTTSKLSVSTVSRSSGEVLLTPTSTPLMVSATSSIIMETSTGLPKPTPTPLMVSSVVMETSAGQPIPTPTQLMVSSVVMETSAGQPTPTQTLPMVSNTVYPTPTATPTPPARCSNSSEVCSSLFDDREYSVITLANSLTVLLISDPASNISSASMDVAAGSFDDPIGYEGLAHFCEHMLFLGTEGFPDEHEYSQFLSTHGGYDNAFTSTQETNYYFDVEASYFEHALDMFSQFFISPLLSEDSVMREIHAVNAEHEKNLQNDGWKLWQLLKNVSNPEHPFSRFNTGSLMTLNQTDIHQQVVDYYLDRYSASTVSMCECVCVVTHSLCSITYVNTSAINSVSTCAFMHPCHYSNGCST